VSGRFGNGRVKGWGPIVALMASWEVEYSVPPDKSVGGRQTERYRPPSVLNDTLVLKASLASQYSARRDVYLDVAALDDDLKRAQHLLPPNHVQQLDAWREVCPLNNLPRA
jgi:hypothetical protein